MTRANALLAQTTGPAKQYTVHLSVKLRENCVKNIMESGNINAILTTPLSLSTYLPITIAVGLKHLEIHEILRIRVVYRALRVPAG